VGLITRQIISTGFKSNLFNLIEVQWTLKTEIWKLETKKARYIVASKMVVT